jgi:hypothetical protein
VSEREREKESVCVRDRDMIPCFPGEPVLSDIPKAMEAEHCHRGRVEFTTPNMKTTTCEVEWTIVSHCDESKADMRRGRRIPNIDELLELDVSKSANLTRDEVISLVLYTGPMVSAPDDVGRVDGTNRLGS